MRNQMVPGCTLVQGGRGKGRGGGCVEASNVCEQREKNSPESNSVQTQNPDETINRCPPCVYTCKKIRQARCRSCSPCERSVDYGNKKITQHEQKVSESK